MRHCVGVCPRLAPSARRPVPIVEPDGREQRRRGRPSWKERGDRHPGPAAPSLALPDREWGRRPHGVSTHPGGLCPSCSDRVASTAPEHECDKREAPGASPLVAGGPGRTAHPDGSQRRHPGQLRQSPIRRHPHRDGYSAPRIRTQPPNRTAPMEARPRVRRLLKQHSDHREEASRSWARPVAESAVAASVKRPYEGQGRKPLFPSGWGGREPPRSLASLDVALVMPPGRHLRSGSLPLPTVAPSTASRAFWATGLSPPSGRLLDGVPRGTKEGNTFPLEYAPIRRQGRPTPRPWRACSRSACRSGR